MNTNAVVTCTNCEERKTRHPSGLCARCRRVGDASTQLCKCCKERRTRHASGFCFPCRHSSSPTPILS